jgi:hypothetical protein
MMEILKQNKTKIILQNSGLDRTRNPVVMSLARKTTAFPFVYSYTSKRFNEIIEHLSHAQRHHLHTYCYKIYFILRLRVDTSSSIMTAA